MSNNTRESAGAPKVTSLLEALDKSFTLFISTAEGFPRMLVREKPNEGAFSAAEIVYHVLAVERLWQARFDQLLAGDHAHFKALDPDRDAAENRYNELPYEEGIAHLIQARQKTRILVSGLTDDDLRLEGIHSKYGPMNIEKMLTMIEGHDRNHAAQLERTLSAVRGRTQTVSATSLSSISDSSAS